MTTTAPTARSLGLAATLAAALTACAPAAPQPLRTPAARAAAQATLEPRAARIEAASSTLASAALGPDGGLRRRSAIVDAFGDAVVRLDQTHAGVRVWGAQLIAAAGADGAVATRASSLRPAIALAGAPRLTAEQASAAALRDLAPRGRLGGLPKVEAIVFPSDRADAPDRSLAARAHPTYAGPGEGAGLASTSPWVWAYEVRTFVNNRLDGLHEYTYVIDGHSGYVLRKRDDLLRVALDPPATINGTDWVSAEPTQVGGTGQYCGAVTLDAATVATAAGDTTIMLWDQTRGTLPHPITGLTGLQTWYEDHPSFSDFVVSGDGSGFGDGLPYTPAPGAEGSPNGQTAAVDAHWGLARTWDFYQANFFLNGLDGLGTTPIAEVHIDPQGGSPDNAFWSGFRFGMFIMDGSYPALPGGFFPLADLDVIAHEASHGVATSAGFFPQGGESDGLSEASADFLSSMVRAWTNGTPSCPFPGFCLIPDDGTDWIMGARIGHGTPLRDLRRPSNDGVSPDAWFEGIGRLDGHFSAGPINRALYFLAQGASPDPASQSYSPYLPGGMKGIGNDLAAHIWLDAFRTRITPDATFADVRAAVIAEATRYEGPAGDPALAAASAFAAVNLGEPAFTSARPRVTFPVFRTSGYVDDTLSIRFRRSRVAGKLTTMKPQAQILNSADQGLVFSIPDTIGRADDARAGGVIDADGTYHTPDLIGWVALQATSKADPLQFAVGEVSLMNLDTDDDLESDASDMGNIALSWFLPGNLTTSHSVIYMIWTDDLDVGLFTDAFRNSFPVAP